MTLATRNRRCSARPSVLVGWKILGSPDAQILGLKTEGCGHVRPSG